MKVQQAEARKIGTAETTDVVDQEEDSVIENEDDRDSAYEDSADGDERADDGGSPSTGEVPDAEAAAAGQYDQPNGGVVAIPPNESLLSPGEEAFSARAHLKSQFFDTYDLLPLILITGLRETK